MAYLIYTAKAVLNRTAFCIPENAFTPVFRTSYFVLIYISCLSLSFTTVVKQQTLQHETARKQLRKIREKEK